MGTVDPIGDKKVQGFFGFLPEVKVPGEVPRRDSLVAQDRLRSSARQSLLTAGPGFRTVTLLKVGSLISSMGAYLWSWLNGIRLSSSSARAKDDSARRQKEAAAAAVDAVKEQHQYRLRFQKKGERFIGADLQPVDTVSMDAQEILEQIDGVRTKFDGVLSEKQRGELTAIETALKRSV